MSTDIPEDPPGTPLAQHHERHLHPVIDAAGDRWSYQAAAGGWMNDNPDYVGAQPCVDLAAIPRDRHPVRVDPES